jgi:hypothetical protein
MTMEGAKVWKVRCRTSYYDAGMTMEGAMMWKVRCRTSYYYKS